VGFQARGPFAAYPQANLNRPAVHGRKDLTPAIEGMLRDELSSENSWPRHSMAGLPLSGHEQPTFQAGQAGPPAPAIPAWTRDSQPTEQPCWSLGLAKASEKLSHAGIIWSEGCRGLHKTIVTLRAEPRDPADSLAVDEQSCAQCPWITLTMEGLSPYDNAQGCVDEGWKLPKRSAHPCA